MRQGQTGSEKSRFDFGPPSNRGRSLGAGKNRQDGDDKHGVERMKSIDRRARIMEGIKVGRDIFGASPLRDGSGALRFGSGHGKSPCVERVRGARRTI